MSAFSSRSRPCQSRLASTTSGSSTGSRPCWRTKPQFFRDCSPGTGPRSTTTTRAPRRARKYAVAQPTMPAPTTTTSASRSMAEAHRRSKTATCQTLGAVTRGVARSTLAPARARRRLPSRARRRHDPVHPQVDHELAVVVADLVQRALPERGAGDGAVAEGKLHGLEELGVGQRRDHLLRA